MAIEVLLIDSKHHAHHLSRRLLVFIVILFEGIFPMTEIALHPERGRDELHGGNKLVGWNSSEYLDVLVNLLRGFGGCRTRRFNTSRRLGGLSPQPCRTRA